MHVICYLQHVLHACKRIVTCLWLPAVLWLHTLTFYKSINYNILNQVLRLL